MKITWYGHACFKADTREGSAVFDPYAPGSVPGLAMPPVTADTVLCSHGHRDHCYPDGVRLTGKTPQFSIDTISCFHDDVGGKLRGENIIHIADAEGMRLAHLGDLGHMLSEGQIEKLGKIDVLLIPVGGNYTIDTKTALELIKRISPRIAIPMHYRGEGFGYDVISTLDEFAANAVNVVRFDTNTVEIGKNTEPMTALLRRPV